MRVSVIIPAYNASETIADAIQSAVGQAISVYDERFPRGGVWPQGPALLERLCRALGPKGEALLLGPYLDTHTHPLEILVVDDGSSDDTVSLVTALAEHMPEGIELRVLSKTNGGPASARNCGIRAAHGDLIAFLDADDLWLPAKLARQVSVMESHPEAAMIYSKSLYFRSTGIFQPPEHKTHLRRSGRIFEDLLLHGNFVHNLTVAARKDVLESLVDEEGQGPLSEEKTLISSEDYDLWMRISAQHPVVFLDEPLTWYRIHTGSLTLSKISRAHEATRVAMRRALELPEARHLPAPMIQKAFAHTWYDEGYEHNELGRPEDAARCFVRSLLISPSLPALKGLLRSGLYALPGMTPAPRSAADRGRDSVSFVGG